MGLRWCSIADNGGDQHLPLCNQRRKCERFQFRRITEFPTVFTMAEKGRTDWEGKEGGRGYGGGKGGREGEREDRSFINAVVDSVNAK